MLPKQVRQQIADAKRIEGELKAAAEATVTPVVADADTPTPTLVETPTEPVAAQPVEPAPVAPAPAPQPDAQYAELLQQYRSLQGIHRALVRTNNDMQSQVTNLQTSVQGLTAEIERLRTQQPAQPATAAPVISDAEIEEFGPDLISVIERKAQQVAAPLNVALEKANAALERVVARNGELELALNGIKTEQAESAQDRFSANLLRLVPNFNTLNHDSRFLSWLSQVDPLDPRKRTLQERLDEAVQLGDAEATASYFRAFMSTQPTPTPTPAPAQRPDISAQAQPTSRSAPDAAPAKTGRQWSQNSISEFYADVARGRYSPTDKARIEREIFVAQKENRIAA